MILFNKNSLEEFWKIKTLFILCSLHL